MAQVSTAGLPFATSVLTTSARNYIVGDTGNSYDLRYVGSAYFNVPSTITVTLQRTFQNPRDPNAVWTSIVTGLTNQDYSYVGPLVSGLRIVWTAGTTGSVVGTVSELPGVAGSSVSPSSVTVTNFPAAAALQDATANPTTTQSAADLMVYNGTTWDRVRAGTNIGSIQVEEQRQPAYEDNTNQNAAVIERLLAGVSTYSPLIFTNFGANATLNVKAAAGNVYGIHCQNTNAAVRYIQLHNTTTTPSGGAVPLLSFAIPAQSSVVIDHTMFVGGGAYFSTGIAFAFSSTVGTYTAATAGEQSTTVIYK